MKKIRVVVFDDSGAMRTLVAQFINGEADMEVVGAAADAPAARQMIRTLNPDVLTLDMEMPGVNGLDFLENLMRVKPMQVVIVTAHTAMRLSAAQTALGLGALGIVAKPHLSGPEGMQEFAAQITAKVRIAGARSTRPQAPVSALPAASGAQPRFSPAMEKLIVIGASTGGTAAVKEVLEHLPPDAPGVLVTQHMPEGFTRSFAARLDSLCRITVKEADHGERVLPGHAYIAPGHSHLLVRRRGTTYVTELSAADPVNRHRPSVDVLFRSAADCGGANVIGVILTGMGKDGAAGMLALHRAGAYTYAQDEVTCVVFGMPKEAVAVGGVDEVLPVDRIAGALVARLAVSGGAGKPQETRRSGR